MQRRTFAGASAAALIGSLAGWPAMAQKISGDVRFLCGFAPGGTADLLCRIMAEAVTPEVGQKVIVDTKTGASGFIANEIVANAPPDGRTIGLAAMAALCVSPVMPGQKLPINVDTDLTPIANIAGVTNMLVVGKHMQYRTVPEIIDFAKKNPGKLNYGSTGSGSSNHLSMELFMSMTGTKMTHVPYKGSAPAVMAMLGGEIDVLFDNVPNLMQQIKAGKLKPIAVTGAERAALLPDTPTVQAAGVPGYEVIVWFGMQMPAGVPKAVVDRANKDIVAILKDPEVVKQFRDQGVEVVASTPEAFGQLLQKEIPKWTKVVNDAGVKIE